MRIAMIGPVYPYRGGIAHYTGLLYQNLSRHHAVEMFSYKMQYPRWLFHKEQKDFSDDSLKIPNTKFLIHTTNPFNLIHVARSIKKEKFDLIIIQWWHPYFAPCDWILTKIMKNENICFVCHNIIPHERFFLDKFLTKQALKYGKHYILHAKEEACRLRELLPDADYVVSPHPTYGMFRMKGITDSEARKQLQVQQEERVILFFGFVRKYKGLRYLLEAMPHVIAKVGQIRLFIVGEFGKDRAEYMELIMKFNLSSHITLVDRYIHDDEIEKYFCASNLVVLPYESATQSGIVQMAYGFEKPVVVTDVGGLPEVVDDARTGYIVPPKDADELANAIVRYFVNHDESNFVAEIRKQAYRFSWDCMREVIEERAKKNDWRTD